MRNGITKGNVLERNVWTSRFNRDVVTAAPRLTTHSTGRAISWLFIENLGGFGGPCAPVNSGVRFLLSGQKSSPL